MYTNCKYKCSSNCNCKRILHVRLIVIPICSIHCKSMCSSEYVVIEIKVYYKCKSECNYNCIIITCTVSLSVITNVILNVILSVSIIVILSCSYNCIRI